VEGRDRPALIVNADDFGMSESVNQGVARAHEHGIVKSASLMVERPAAEEAVRYARSRSLDLGLHVDLGEWAFEDGAWVTRRPVTEFDDPVAVTDVVMRQIERFRMLVDREPTHLDSHQHVHLGRPARSILSELARELEVPLRDLSREVRYCGAFYGRGRQGEPLRDAIGVEALLGLVASLGPGVTELGCHPGEAADPGDPYGAERAIETETLCDPRVRRAIEAAGVELWTFSDLLRQLAV
jgi:predicted glycoside hydrolase/deacetylase ChbG (UPF0249 family)